MFYISKIYGGVPFTRKSHKMSNSSHHSGGTSHRVLKRNHEADSSKNIMGNAITVVQLQCEEETKRFLKTGKLAEN